MTTFEKLVLKCLVALLRHHFGDSHRDKLSDITQRGYDWNQRVSAQRLVQEIEETIDDRKRTDPS